MKLILIVLTSLFALCNINKPEIISVYTANEILHIDKENLSISFESSEETIAFDTFKELSEYIEEYTADSSTPVGYARNLQEYVDAGIVKIDIEPVINQKGKVIDPIGKTTLYYYGPNWNADPENDTIVTLGVFLNSETYSISYDEFKNKEYKLITVTN